MVVVVNIQNDAFLCVVGDDVVELSQLLVALVHVVNTQWNQQALVSVLLAQQLYPLQT